MTSFIRGEWEWSKSFRSTYKAVRKIRRLENQKTFKFYHLSKFYFRVLSDRETYSTQFHRVKYKTYSENYQSELNRISDRLPDSRQNILLAGELNA